MAIERLTPALRRSIGMDAHAARGMHVVSDTNIDMPVRPTFYRVPQADGSVKRYALFDNFGIVDILKNISGRYRAVSRKIFNEQKSIYVIK